MRGYRFLFVLCLTATLVFGFGMLAAVAVDGDGDSQLDPRLTQTASYTPSPTSTATLDPNITFTPTPSETSTSTSTPTATPLSLELLVNGGFEAADSADPDQPREWVMSDLSKDKRKCDASKAYEGDCYYQFKNGESENSRLTQDIPLPAVLPSGVQLKLSGAYLAKGDPLLKLRVYVSYASLPQHKLSVKLKGITYGVYQSFVSQPLSMLATATKIEVVLLNKGTFGKVLLDDLHLVADEGGVLPLRLP